jgi:uncharacterized protein (TIGR02118 family)
VVKLIVAVRRRNDMSPEEFHAHWRSRHADLVRANPASRRYVRRYIQCHTLPQEYERGEPAFDGTAELWFDSMEDMNRFYSDPDYLAGIKPDEGRFADMERTLFVVTQEEAVIGEV